MTVRYHLRNHKRKYGKIVVRFIDSVKSDYWVWTRLYSRTEDWPKTDDDIQKKLDDLERFIFKNVPLSGLRSRRDLEDIITKFHSPNIGNDKSLIKTYLIYDGRYYKIGISTRPEKRLSSIKSLNPSAQIIHLINSNVETELHNRYRYKRIHGEWFDLNNRDVDLIKAIV